MSENPIYDELSATHGQPLGEYRAQGLIRQVGVRIYVERGIGQLEAYVNHPSNRGQK